MRALELAELGTERPLTASERIGLRYHGRLCPFCGCAAGAFKDAKARLARAEQARKSPPPPEALQ